ncbi:hypothetical protein [Haloarcula salinisoli]|uniref:Uncharacterized protein n=1 Tax=Haloarcula salinisoli TaxID=2487746 RepID=A0A8J7YG64_9EURY|nr:hypothetical protein [Halomicroarcula salinisoli]MBX0302731.1 hypothetical protein [Halomicroarcula salinisoli]
MQSLSDGYVDVLDARDHLEDGEAAFRDENYDQADTAFSDAGATADRAETTFSDGEPGDEASFFDDAFDRAFQRTSVLQSLSEGYGLVVQSRATAEAGRQELRGRNFEAAKSKFQTADSTLGEAERVFTGAQSDAGEAYGPEIDRALCRVGHLRNAMDHFVAASQAGSDGDRDTLESELTAGETDIDRAGEC